MFKFLADTNKMKKAQTSIELIMMVSFLLIFFVAFIAIIGVEIGDKRNDLTYGKLADLAKFIQQELILAGESSDGYHRTFILPEKVSNQEYVIQIEGNTLAVKGRKYTVPVEIPLFSGTLDKGANRITKAGGIIYVN